MRFGKKLALRVNEDTSGAPYLSHKPMKEAINRTVREIRLYQSRLATVQQPVPDGSGNYFMPPGDTSCVAELARLEANVRAYDQQLFHIVDCDIKRILGYVRLGEARLSAEFTTLQKLAMQIGLLVEESKLASIERILPFVQRDRGAFCRRLLALHLRGDPAGTAQRLEDLSARFSALVDMANHHAQFSALVDMANHHAQYMEINVAGFRKLLKRHEKQIPASFHTRRVPCLGYHSLVTRTSRQLFVLVRQFRAILIDARRRVATSQEEVPELDGQQEVVPEFTGLGPECEMVVTIQRQLRSPDRGQRLQFDPGLYSKPGAPLPGSMPHPAHAENMVAYGAALPGPSPHAFGTLGMYLGGAHADGPGAWQGLPYPPYAGGAAPHDLARKVWYQTTPGQCR